MEARLTTPFGHVVVRQVDGKLTAIHLRPFQAPTFIPEGFPEELLEPLQDYFAGRTGLPEAPVEASGTAFQMAVWRALASVPPGEPISYGEMALRIGRPGAARAVGQALRNNPLPILWPCHRVVTSDGKLGGFGGASNMDDPEDQGQLGIKAWLLEHEQRMVAALTV